MPKPVDHIVNLSQPARRLIPLLLELQSSSGLFGSPEYCRLVEMDQDFFIYRFHDSSFD
jgi:hypothetical protein